jgi:hypothetical protein
MSWEPPGSFDFVPSEKSVLFLDHWLEAETGSGYLREITDPMSQ